MTSFVRGATIFFDATTTDQLGQPLAPSSATLHLVYLNSKQEKKTVDLVMTISGNVASAQWDSSISGVGGVSWNIKAVGSITVAKSGVFTLTA
jgi:hypothetical protein